MYSIAPSAYQTGKKEGRREKTDGQNSTQIGLSWVHTSQLTLHVMKQGLQSTQLFVTGEDE
jgi:hypothetical protein